MLFINKISCQFLLLLSSAALLFSCDNTTTEPGPVTVPSIWGQLGVVKDNRMEIAGTDTTYTQSQMALANFFVSPQVTNMYIDAGIVEINNIPLGKDASNRYTVATSSGLPTLGLENTTNWHIPGNGSVPVATFNYNDTFPEYIAALPDEIVKANGITLMLDTSTVKGADSVRVYIHDGAGTNYMIWSFAANAGSITVPAADLSGLPSVSDHSATIGIFAYTGKVKVFSNKGFYFIKENRRYRSVNIF